MKKRVGIFTKIYRLEPSMIQCIESIKCQTYTNWKLYILVNDATKETVNGLINENPKIVLIDGGTNGGFTTYASMIARDGNDYVGSVDADDWLADTYIQKIVEFAEKNNTDMTSVGNYFVYADNQYVPRSYSEKVYERDDLEIFFRMNYAAYRTIWGKLFRSELLRDFDEKNLPQVDEYGGYGGDTLFCLYILQVVNRFGVLSDILYFYRVSASSSSYMLKKGRLDSDDLLLRYAEMILERTKSKSLRNSVFLQLVYGNAILDTTKLILGSSTSESEKISNLLYIFKKDSIPLFLELDRKGFRGKDIPSFLDDLVKMVFSQEKATENCEVASMYIDLVEIWYPSISGVISVPEMEVLLTKKGLFHMFIHKEYSMLFGTIISNMKEFHNIEEATKFLRRLTNDHLLRDLLQKEVIVLGHSKLLIELFNSDDKEALEYCISAVQKNDFGATELLDVWILLAARTERVHEYILGKQIRIENRFILGDYEMAKEEYNELVELGVNDDNMVYLKNKLFESGDE